MKRRRLVPLILAGAICISAMACGGVQKPTSPTSEVEPAPEGKLPDGVRPTEYQLSLTIVPDSNGFSGKAVIGLELDQPVTGIWMHGQDLNVTAIHARHGDVQIDATWKQRTGDGVARVEFGEKMPAGHSSLHIEYTAGFDDPLRGLYKVESGGQAYAFTQFESISARLAFPSFDEPRFKTPFDVTLTVPTDQFAAANTPIERTIDLPDGLQRIHFKPTPPLPTYLVAWAVGPLDIVPGPPVPRSEMRPHAIPLRGIAADGKGGDLQYALARTGEFVELLEGYFAIPYPYQKLDVVAVPDFGAGAMENVGLITFREWLLLISGRRATENQRRAFAHVMAHELAHIAARHGTRQATRGQIVNLASIPLIFMGGWTGYGIRQAASILSPLGFLKFSRGFEKEADLLGLQYMYKAGYDPTAFVDFVEKLQAAEKRKPGTMAKVFSSHPPTGGRIKFAQQNIQTILDAKPEYVVTTSEFNKVKARLARLENRRVGDKPEDPNRPRLKKRNSGRVDSKGNPLPESTDEEDRPTLKRRN